tara:strand:- start:5 stop:187 length:183 start_codon:yes stop_codon:yes gene_type:complete
LAWFLNNDLTKKIMKKTELENLQNIISCFCGKTTKKNNDCDGSHWACVGDFLLSKKTLNT